MTRPKEAMILIRGLTAADKAKIRKVARAERDRTMSAFVRRVLFNYIKEKEGVTK